MKIGDEVYVHGYIDEIRQDTVIIRNDGGYFGTVPSEVVEQEPIICCKECKHHGTSNCPMWGDDTTEDYMWCCDGERMESDTE